MSVKPIHVHHQFQNVSTHLVLLHVVVRLGINPDQSFQIREQESSLDKMRTKTVLISMNARLVTTSAPRKNHALILKDGNIQRKSKSSYGPVRLSLMKGSYECVCSTGYELIGLDCEDRKSFVK